MTGYLDPAKIDVIIPNFKRRLSGVTATVVRLVPLQAEEMAVAAVAPTLPDRVPQIRLRDLLSMPAAGPSGPRVWHARRNSEMLAGLILKYALGKRLKLLFTSASQRRHTHYSKALIARMDAVISTSRKTAEYLDCPSRVILHGIDAETFCPPTNRGAARSALGLPKGRLIGCYGRIRMQKGTDVFVDAMIRVLRIHPDITAIVMGRATRHHQGFERKLREQVAAAGLSDRLLFKPEVPVQDMAAWYQTLDLFVAPQRWEGFGLTPLEAMACAVPVIATMVGAFEELVVPGETGVLIPPGDVTAMAEAVARLLDNPAELARQARAARQRIETKFRLEDEARAIMGIYRGLLEN